MIKEGTPDYSERLTFAACCERLRAEAPLQTPAIPPSTVEAVISTVRSGLQFWISNTAQESELATSRPSTSLIEELDVRPLLPILAAEARRMAEQRGHRSPRNAERLAERFVEVVAGTNFTRLSAESRDEFLSAGWRRLLALVPDEYQGVRNQVNATHYVSRAAIICALHGVTCPSELPAREELERWLAEGGIDKAGSQKVVCFLRRLARASLKRDPALQVPVYSRKYPTSVRNLAAEPMVRSLLSEPIPDDVPPSERRRTILREVAPSFARLLEQHSKAAATALRPATVSVREEALDRCVAGLVRLGFGAQLKQMHPQELFSTERPTGLLGIRPAASDDSWLNDDELRQLGLHGREDTLPLIAHIGDERARAAWVNSPRSKRAGASAEPQYVKAIADDCERVWNMFESVYGPILAQRNPELLARCRMGAERALAHLRGGSGRGAPSVKDKAKLVSLVTLPQLICVGLPTLAAHVRDLERLWKLELEHALSCGRDHTHAPARRAKKQYLLWLECYVVLAVFCADPMRYKNLAYPRVGRGSEIEIRGAVEDGRLKILGIRSLFSPDDGDNAHATLKVKKSRYGTRRRQARIWHWHPSIIDFELVSDYLSLVWFPLAMPHAAKAMPAGQPDARAIVSALHEPPVGRSALFLSALRTSHPWGGLSKNPISGAFGRALHWICRNALGRDLPDWTSLQKSEWFGIFAPHTVRTLWATYWIGIRGQQTIRCPMPTGQHPSNVRVPQVSATEFAMRATNDDERTLSREYEATTELMKALLQSNDVSSWEHPSAYDAWMDHLPWIQSAFPVEMRSALPLPPHLQEKVEHLEPRSQTRRKKRSRRIAST